MLNLGHPHHPRHPPQHPPAPENFFDSNDWQSKREGNAWEIDFDIDIGKLVFEPVKNFVSQIWTPHTNSDKYYGNIFTKSSDFSAGFLSEFLQLEGMYNVEDCLEKRQILDLEVMWGVLQLFEKG